MNEFIKITVEIAVTRMYVCDGYLVVQFILVPLFRTKEAFCVKVKTSSRFQNMALSQITGVTVNIGWPLCGQCFAKNEYVVNNDTSSFIFGNLHCVLAETVFTRSVDQLHH